MVSDEPREPCVPRQSQGTRKTMKLRVFLFFVFCSLLVVPTALAQRSFKKPKRATPPTFRPNEFSGIFFSDVLSHLQGDMPSAESALASNSPPIKTTNAANGKMSEAIGNSIWKEMVSATTIEDLIKESKTRLDGMVTTPAKFSGGVADVRREFTLMASTMAVIAQYPEEIRWQSSAGYAQRIFARMAVNCKVGTQPVFNEAKQRQQDLQNLLKGTKLTGTADEVSWAETADRGPSMQILEWALRENLTPATNSEKSFRERKEEILKYAELIAMFGNIIQQPGMNDADDDEYKKFAVAMTQAALDVLRAVRANDAELARTTVGRIDQACNKCHQTYR